MNITEARPSLAAQWKHWGAGFNVPPCEGPVNLEQLLIETAKGLESNARLLVMAVTWLSEHYLIVEVDELAKLAEKLRGRDSARLGLMLEMAQEFIGCGVFERVLSVCEPQHPPEPLFEMDRSRPTMARLAEQSASEISRKWGLWTQPIEVLKHDAMRPASWIAQHNRTFMLRNLLKGDVRAKVITALAEQGLQNVSETELAHRAGCTRRAMHLALDNLETSGLIMRKRLGRSYIINLCRQYSSLPFAAKGRI